MHFYILCRTDKIRNISTYKFIVNINYGTICNNQLLFKILSKYLSKIIVQIRSFYMHTREIPIYLNTEINSKTKINSQLKICSHTPILNADMRTYSQTQCFYTDRLRITVWAEVNMFVRRTVPPIVCECIWSDFNKNWLIVFVCPKDDRIDRLRFRYSPYICGIAHFSTDLPKIRE